ncbi:unnamed protein product [Kuraishia capsulata CBS 1993]|uniref:Uncharacterized protein n=1 Tax=Kuraishia capsulata CBS 1993 TaxID=1382522 RepID=W6MQF5_9ASCO|nr:uncharacterized protein KUCA_T00004521001 [Kuraishia capsulata CBS 1993]CDK28538.1 unnamed protein product [Kuraishia capsulata CBS 1993]
MLLHNFINPCCIAALFIAVVGAIEICNGDECYTAMLRVSDIKSISQTYLANGDSDPPIHDMASIPVYIFTLDNGAHLVTLNSTDELVKSGVIGKRRSFLEYLLFGFVIYVLVYAVLLTIALTTNDRDVKQASDFLALWGVAVGDCFHVLWTTVAYGNRHHVSLFADSEKRNAAIRDYEKRRTPESASRADSHSKTDEKFGV